MKKTLLLGLITLLLPLNMKAQWHDWSAAKMSQVTTNKCTWKYSSDVYWEDNKSIMVDYEPGATITFPTNYGTFSYRDRMYLMLTIFNPATTHTSDKITVDFIASGSVTASWSMTTRRRGWNVFKALQTETYTEPYFYDFDVPLQGRIPTNLTHIRIHMPNHSGKLCIGKLLFANEKTFNTTLGYGRAEKFYPVVEDAVLPPMPESVTDKQREEIATISTRLDEVYGVMPEAQVDRLPTDVKEELKGRYDSYKISRNGDVINGYNIMQKVESTGWYTHYNQYGELALYVATWYRNVQNEADKAMLKEWYYNLYDYGIFINGLFDYWSAGLCFTSSMFLMRDDLIATNRITDEVIFDMRKTLGFEITYLDYSFYLKHYRKFRRSLATASRPYVDGELGEDVDYMRIASIRLIMTALFNKDEKEQVRDLKAVQHYFSEIALEYSPTILDGFKEDGTLNHHWGWIDGYGVDALHKLPFIAYTLSHTEFSIATDAIERLYKQIVSQDMRSLCGIIPANLTGKGGELWAYGGKGIEPIDRYAYMAKVGADYGESSDLDSWMAETFMRLYPEALKTTATPVSAFTTRSYNEFKAKEIRANREMSGHKTFSQGLAFVHRRNDWIASLKATGKYSYLRESGDPFIHFFGFGHLDIHYKREIWNRYNNQRIRSDVGAAGYDWRKVPGATTINMSDYSKMVNKEYKRYWSESRFVGGVTQGDDGVFTTHVLGSVKNGFGSFNANKSYFCFDNNIVCVGSNISNSLSDATVTTLFQDAVTNAARTYFASTGGFTNNSTINQTLTANNWVMNSHSTGYWLPKGTAFNLVRGSQTNPNWTNKTTATGTFATAWINHGSAPQNANYWYVNKIDVTPQQMSDFASQMNSSTPPFLLLANSSKVQAVESILDASYGIVAINAEEALNIKEIIAVNRPAVIMVKQPDSNTRILSVADPDVDYSQNRATDDNELWSYGQQHLVTVEIEGKWHVKENDGVVEFDNSQADKTIVTFAVKNGLTSTVILSDKSTGSEESIIKPTLVYDNNQIIINNNGESLSQAIGAIYSLDGKLVDCKRLHPEATSYYRTDFLTAGTYLFILDKGRSIETLKFQKD